MVGFPNRQKLKHFIYRPPQAASAEGPQRASIMPLKNVALVNGSAPVSGGQAVPCETGVLTCDDGGEKNDLDQPSLLPMFYANSQQH